MISTLLFVFAARCSQYCGDTGRAMPGPPLRTSQAGNAGGPSLPAQRRGAPDDPRLAPPMTANMTREGSTHTIDTKDQVRNYVIALRN
jgi:hypothetical protein